MAAIPKKVVERYMQSVPKFQKVLQIAKDRDVNESDTVSILNDIFGEVFGYDKYLEVTSEFSIRSTYCDLALKVDDKVQFLIEVKAIGMDLKEPHLRQVIEYGANHGVPWVILTNSIDWNLYRIRFEQPINFDLVCSFNFSQLKPRDEKDQECLFLLSKEGLTKNIRDEYYDKVQSVNRYIIGNLITSEPVLNVIRRELRKFSDGMKVDVDDIEGIIQNEVLKREVVVGDEAEAARIKIAKFYKKGTPRKKQITSEAPDQDKTSITEQLLEEAEKQQ